MDLDGTTCIQVSDCLKDRHPYSRSDRGTVINSSNGFGLGGIQDSISTLGAKEGKSVKQKEEALVHLLRKLSSAEMKTRLVSMGLLQGLKEVTTPPGSLSLKCDKLACDALRQLSVLPSCMADLYANNCVEMVVAVLQHHTDPTTQLAACNALKQMSEIWDGKALLLGEPLPEGMVEIADDLQTTMKRDNLARGIVAALTSIILHEHKPLVTASLKTLANLTTLEKGLQHALCENVFADINKLLENTSASEDWMFNDDAVEIVHQSVVVVWNISLDDFGKERSLELPLVPYTLGRLLHAVLKYPDKLINVKASIAGAISAMYVRADAKRTCLTPLHDPPLVEAGAEVDLCVLLVKLLKQANALYGPIQKAVKHGVDIDDSNLSHVTSVIANCNQCIRLLSELPCARKRVKSILENEDIYIRRQIFYGTHFEAEFLPQGVKTY
eukprot:TRINITY_DN3308_c0_g2_i1.p1 TRINITY_DN3308_c0_g2~~TRINITY_DN3308_c0_g2_i1.p1  ORF type:complete len:442 (+),score=125.35 TRINITY_DN3308_c0_g2_i1:36-1361(+)